MGLFLSSCGVRGNIFTGRFFLRNILSNFNVRKKSYPLYVMRKIPLLFLFIALAQPLLAKHIIGGEMFYTYLGAGRTPNTSVYRITLKLFRDDHAPPDAAAMPGNVYIGVFSNDTRRQYPSDGNFFDVRKDREAAVKVNAFPVCMVRPPSLSYNSATYSLEIELPDNTSGYTAAYQTCCRIRPIDNIYDGGSGAGSTFACNIPPVKDNSPTFKATIDAVCGGKPFRLEFGAEDSDNDSLSYAFAGAFDGGSVQNASNVNPAPPPYHDVYYKPGYSSLQPLGANATMDPATGIITGIAPPAGRYVVTVAVTSWRRNGTERIKLSTHRKDFIINVSGCDMASAQLNPRGSYCDDYAATFWNDDFSSLNKTFNWEFYDDDSLLILKTTDEEAKVKFPKEGRYHYKLTVNRGNACADSAIASIDVYPGFKPAFNFDGKCINSDVFFTDKSTAKFGVIDSWRWDFGVPGMASDTSLEQNPKFTFDKKGDYKVSLIVQSTVGCIDTLVQTVKMIDKPEFSVSNDTLICSIDDLPIYAYGQGGTVQWTPAVNIDNVHSFNPVVNPKRTTTYYANYEESRGCNNMDSVVVKVVDFVSLTMPADTIICLTDSIVLHPVTDGLRFQWSPAATIVSSSEKFPMVFPKGNTIYQLTATIGGCNTTGRVAVRTVPYPLAKASPDTTLCIGSQVQLTATGGSIYEWQPAVFLNDTKVARPVASPGRSIQYVVKVNDVLGCPKPGFDTLSLKVMTPFVDAGPRDTAIVVEEPLYLNAVANGENFLWSPSRGLNNPTVSNPIARLTSDQQYVVQVITEGNCVATDTIMVKVYNLKPGFYIPNAFTPNSDGLNDVLRPIAFGLRSLMYFKIYNRLGEVVFITNRFNDGWDGTYKGSPQGAGVFAWTAEAVDYTGKRIIAQGQITLIR